LRPYQLATGKNGNPLATGKPFINNFLPSGGDMLRLNMAVPATDRSDPRFSSLGLVQAAILGLTDTMYNTSSELEFIPNMDGFPNGRRLEDDVTRIELQAVSGVVLAAIGLFYDDFTVGASPVTNLLINVLQYSTGVEANDTSFRTAFPYIQMPWIGTGKYSGKVISYTQPEILDPTNSVPSGILGMASPLVFVTSYPNPFRSSASFKYQLQSNAHISIRIFDLNGKLVATVVNSRQAAGEHLVNWNTPKVSQGTYIARVSIENQPVQTLKINKAE
jgi:hypothetical protein